MKYASGLDHFAPQVGQSGHEGQSIQTLRDACPDLGSQLQPVAVTQNTMKNCKFNQILSNFGVLVVKGSQRWCKV